MLLSIRSKLHKARFDHNRKKRVYPVHCGKIRVINGQNRAAWFHFALVSWVNPLLAKNDRVRFWSLPLFYILLLRYFVFRSVCYNITCSFQTFESSFNVILRTLLMFKSRQNLLTFYTHAILYQYDLIVTYEVCNMNYKYTHTRE